MSRRILARLLAAPLALCPLLLPAPPAAALTNPSFDTSVTGWVATDPSQVTVTFAAAHDAGERSSSGALRLTDVGVGVDGAHGVLQCSPLAAGQTVVHGLAWVLVPPGQPATGKSSASLVFYSDGACQQSITGEGREAHDAAGRWVLLDLSETEVPPGAHSVGLLLGVAKTQAGGTYHAFFDEVRLCADGSEGCAAFGSLPPIEPGEYWDFQFRVLIGGRPGRLEPSSECLPQTVCISGALPGRTEVMIRVIGPKPNGHRWFQVVRFTPAEVVVEARQFLPGAQIVRTYLLSPSTPTARPLSLEDRSSFLPFSG